MGGRIRTGKIMSNKTVGAESSAVREQKIFTVISEVTGRPVEDLGKDMSLVDDIAPNSIDRITLFMALEDEFGRPIPEDELKDVHTLRELIGYVEAALGDGSAHDA